jgi:transposase
MRYELNDYEWSIIRPMLPNKPRGIPRVDDRRILNGTVRKGRPLPENRTQTKARSGAACCNRNQAKRCMETLSSKCNEREVDT